MLYSNIQYLSLVYFISIDTTLTSATSPGSNALPMTKIEALLNGKALCIHNITTFLFYGELLTQILPHQTMLLTPAQEH